MNKNLKLQVEKQLKANPLDLQVILKTMELAEEKERLTKALQRIHNDVGVCGNDSIGKWGVEEYCNNVLNDNNFSV